ncbi:flagellar associated protein [Scenedesmus sp. NREL 46B-D3]|nr:flagellar associated protein [Scenedesmus sp. NREL 46B-D3]
MAGECHSIGSQSPVAKQFILENASPSTRLLEKRRQMFEVQEALELQKQEFARKEEILRKREEALKKKDLELQESLIRFSKFLQENDSKRARADKKAADEVKSRQQKEKEIEQLTEVLEQLREEKEHVHDVLEKYMQYQRYLESVLESADEYQEIQDLLLRHATLQATNDDLRAHQLHSAAEAEEIRVALQAFTKQKMDEILNLNNKLSQLKKQLESYEQQAAQQELKKDYSLRVASQRTLEYGQVVL